MSLNEFILGDSTWSHSRITTFQICPHAYDLQYIQGFQPVDNAFGQFGEFCHKVLEKYFKKELSIFEVERFYIDNYDKFMTIPFPPSRTDLSVSYYNRGLNYFANFEGLPGECLGVENRYYYKVGDYDFQGIIDYEGMVDGNLEIIDYKSKSNKGADGRMLCKTRLMSDDVPFDFVKTLDGRFLSKEIVRQLYLYCIPLKEKYGKYPMYLSLNMFKIDDWFKFQFDEHVLEESIEWAVDLIDRILKTEKFLKGEFKKPYFCDWICGQAGFCTNSMRFLGIEA